MKTKNLYLGRADFEVSKETSIDIDDKFDYKLAKMLMDNK